MSDLINGRAPKEIKIGLRNMLETCADICGVKDVICSEMCCAYDGDNCCHETILMGALAYIEHLEAQQPKWISVEERLPEADKYVLVVVKNYGYGDTYSDVAMYDGELWVRDAGPYFDIIDKGEVTHWMPLPEPPKEENV